MKAAGKVDTQQMRKNILGQRHVTLRNQDVQAMLDEIERLEAFVAKMREIPKLAEGHNSAHNWASMRVEDALKALDAGEGGE